MRSAQDLPSGSVYAPAAPEHVSAPTDDAAPEHPGAWNARVYVVKSANGVHWVGYYRKPAEMMAEAVRGEVLTLAMGEAYLEGR